MGKENGNFYLLLFPEGPPGKTGDNHGGTIEGKNFLRGNILGIVKAVNEAVGILVSLGIRELEEMKSLEKGALADALEALFYPDILETGGGGEHPEELILISLGLDHLDQFINPPGFLNSVLLELRVQLVGVTEDIVVADFVSNKGELERNLPAHNEGGSSLSILEGHLLILD